MPHEKIIKWSFGKLQPKNRGLRQIVFCWLNMMACSWLLVSLKTGQNRSFFKYSVYVCLSGHHPVESQMGVCEEDYYCKPALPTQSPSPRFKRPRFHLLLLALLEVVGKQFAKHIVGWCWKRRSKKVFESGRTVCKLHKYWVFIRDEDY